MTRHTSGNVSTTVGTAVLTTIDLAQTSATPAWGLVVQAASVNLETVTVTGTGKL